MDNTSLIELTVCRDYTSLYQTTTIHYMAFKFADGRTRKRGTLTDDCITFKSDKGYPIVGFHGRAGKEINKLGVIYAEANL